MMPWGPSKNITPAASANGGFFEDGCSAVFQVGDGCVNVIGVDGDVLEAVVLRVSLGWRCGLSR